MEKWLPRAVVLLVLVVGVGLGVSGVHAAHSSTSPGQKTLAPQGHAHEAKVELPRSHVSPCQSVQLGAKVTAALETCRPLAADAKPDEYNTFHILDFAKYGQPTSRAHLLCQSPKVSPAAEAGVADCRKLVRESLELFDLCREDGVDLDRRAEAREHVRALVHFLRETCAPFTTARDEGEKEAMESVQAAMMDASENDDQARAEWVKERVSARCPLYSAVLSKTPPDVKVEWNNLHERVLLVSVLPQHLAKPKSGPIDRLISFPAACAFEQMHTASGGVVKLTGAFRSLERQKELYDLFLEGKGDLAMIPGTSDHGLGVGLDLAIDCGDQWQRAATDAAILTSQSGVQLTLPYAPATCVADPAYAWALENMHKFGFRRSVAASPEHITLVSETPLPELATPMWQHAGLDCLTQKYEVFVADQGECERTTTLTCSEDSECRAAETDGCKSTCKCGRQALNTCTCVKSKPAGRACKSSTAL